MKRPRLQVVVSVVEIISSLAVVASLVYVGYEFRRSKTLSSHDVENFVYQRMLEMDRLLVENPEFGEVVVKASSAPGSLSPAERARYLAYEHILYDSWESAWTYHRSGVLEESSWRGWNTWFTAEARRRPRLGWVGNRKNFEGGFLEYVDEVQRTSAAPHGASGE